MHEQRDLQSQFGIDLSKRKVHVRTEAKFMRPAFINNSFLKKKKKKDAMSTLSFGMTRKAVDFWKHINRGFFLFHFNSLF